MCSLNCCWFKETFQQYVTIPGLDNTMFQNNVKKVLHQNKASYQTFIRIAILRAGLEAFNFFLPAYIYTIIFSKSKDNSLISERIDITGYDGSRGRLKLPGAVAQRCSVKKVFLRISQNSQESTCARVSFLIKLTLTQAFSCEFREMSKNTFFTEHLRWPLLDDILFGQCLAQSNIKSH